MSDQPTVVHSVDDEYLISVAQDPDHLALLRELGPVSFLSMPLCARGRVFGSLVFITTRESGRHYLEGDVSIAREVARRAALAVDHALLFKEARHAVRMRDDMLAVVSHDLKNPLGTISMATEFILEQVVPDDSVHALERRYLGMIARATGHMQRLISDLLDVSAVEGGRLTLDRRRHSPALLLDDARHLLEPLAAAKDIELVVTGGSDLPPVLTDRDRLLQVLGNLGGNAVKFTPSGGRISLHAERHPTEIAFEVRDTGVGIASVDVPHVFDRFWQAHTTARLGSGLGLAIAKGIVEAHGGRIEARSVVAQGSTFRFTIPILAAAAKESAWSEAIPALERRLAQAS